MRPKGDPAVDIRAKSRESAEQLHPKPERKEQKCRHGEHAPEDPDRKQNEHTCSREEQQVGAEDSGNGAARANHWDGRVGRDRDLGGGCGDAAEQVEEDELEVADGVLDEGVGAVRELAHHGPLEAAIGPGAGRCCYEVGEEVHEQFAAYGERARNGSNVDLKLIAREQLERAGVQTVHDTDLCTICAPASLFFSHRRDKGVTGRMAAIISPVAS